MLITPPLRAVAQLDDPVFLGVLLQSLLWALAGFAGLAVLVGWGAHEAVLAWLPPGQDGGWWDWLAYAAGPAGAVLLALLLFLPVVSVIATLFIDRVAASVERRWYPQVPPAAPAPLSHQLWDGLELGLRVLAMQVLALLLSLLLPGIGWALGWAIAAWAIGRGLFMAVAMRRMGRAQALWLYRRRRMAVLVQGALMAALGMVPLLNLLAPVFGTAALVHVLHAPEERT